MVAPYRGILPAAAIQSMEEQFSGACTVEIAAFDEFSKLLGDPAATAAFDTLSSTPHPPATRCAC
jgi:arsenite-transporting ATPase